MAALGWVCWSSLGCAGVVASPETTAPPEPPAQARASDGAFLLAHAVVPRGEGTSLEHPPAEHTDAREILAVCEGAKVEPKQPTCRMTQAQSVGGLRFATSRLRGGVKWCAGSDPLPWVSSARAAKLDATYQELGLGGRPPATKAALTRVINHNFAIVEIAERPFLVATSGQAIPLTWADPEAASDPRELVRDVASGGFFPPSKGALLRMPAGFEPIVAIERDGKVRSIPRPHEGARYVGWSSSGGGHDSLWRWASPRPGAPHAETWAVVHHAPNGDWAGEPELFAPPALCDEAAGEATMERGLRFSSGARGVRVAADRGVLCIDRARGEEDRRFWRNLAGAGGVAVDERSTERVTCDRWRVELRSGPHAATTSGPGGDGASPALAVRYLER